MNKERRGLNETLQSLPEDLHLEERLLKYMADNVDRTFENIQKSTEEVFQYLSIINVSDKYVEAVSKVDSLMEVIRELIQEYIDNFSTLENQHVQPPKPRKRVNKVTKKLKPTKQQNKKITKNLNIKQKSKSETKMNAKQTKRNVDEIALDQLDKTKFEVSIINPITSSDKNIRRSQRVKYPPINQWAGEKLVQLHDGSYALITSKTNLKPELIVANKKNLTQLKKQPKIKRLQKKKPQVNKKDPSAKSKSKSKGGRRTLYSPTMWMDSLTSNPDLFYAYETDDGNNQAV